jgi:hypothetical protein
MTIENFKELQLNHLTDEDVLFFVRNYGKKGIFNVYYPKNLLDSFSNLKEYRTISEYNVGNEFINLNAVDLSEISYDDYTRYDEVLDFEEIRYRCRALREISIHESTQLIYKAAKAVDRILNLTPPKLIVSLIVDNYVMDVLKRLCLSKSITFMEVIGFFVPGYFRLTDGGIGVKIREVDQEEVEQLYTGIYTKQKSHLAVNKNRAFKNALKDYISYRYRFVTRYTYKHKIKNSLLYENRFMPYFKGFHRLNKLNANRFFSKLDELNEINHQKSVFCPLHFHPEATIDYWSDHFKHADYLNSLIKVIAFYKQKNVVVIFKEHPNYYLRRDINFYKTLLSFGNTLILDPYIPTQKVFEIIENVAVYTGSAGVEALILDKKVYKISDNYYSHIGIPHYTEFPAFIFPLDKESKLSLLRDILETTIKK